MIQNDGFKISQEQIRATLAAVLFSMGREDLTGKESPVENLVQRMIIDQATMDIGFALRPLVLSFLHVAAPLYLNVAATRVGIDLLDASYKTGKLEVPITSRTRKQIVKEIRRRFPEQAAVVALARKNTVRGMSLVIKQILFEPARGKKPGTKVSREKKRARDPRIDVRDQLLATRKYKDNPTLAKAIHRELPGLDCEVESTLKWLNRKRKTKQK